MALLIAESLSFQLTKGHGSNLLLQVKNEWLPQQARRPGGTIWVLIESPDGEPMGHLGFEVITGLDQTTLLRLSAMRSAVDSESIPEGALSAISPSALAGLRHAS